MDNVWHVDHYNSGDWSRTPAHTTTAASHAQITAITSIPGTRSMWAAGELIEKNGLAGATVKYGP